MALDFPANPVDGEVFGSYIWSESKGVWQSREESATVAIMSPTAPTSPLPGDIWVNTSEGTAFAYYNDGSSSQWIELVNSAVPKVEEAMPVATIVQTARTTPPSGWLFCEGQTVSRIAYASLFSAIGTYYGSGDGSTTFTLPNLKGRVPVGLDSSQTEFDVLGETGGAKTHTLSVAETPAHAHTFSGTTSTDGVHEHGGVFNTYSNTGSGTSGINRDLRGTANQISAYAGSHSHTYSGTTSSSGSNSAHNNLQPYIVLNYMIKV